MEGLFSLLLLPIVIFRCRRDIHMLSRLFSLGVCLSLVPLCDVPCQQVRLRHDLVLNSFDKGNCLSLVQVVLSVSILLIYKNLLIVYLEHVCCNTSHAAAYHQHEKYNNHPLLTPYTLAPYTLSMV